MKPRHFADAWRPRRATLCALALSALAGPAAGQEVAFRLAGGDSALGERLRTASAVAAARDEGVTNSGDLLAAARADYARILSALYAEGFFGGTINISIDGREAANIAPFDAPARIGTITIRVAPGPAYRFSRAEVTPLAEGTELPEGFRRGAVAETGVIRDAAEAAVDGWRAVGRAKAEVAGQSITADHARRTLSADVTVAPGPRLRFGDLTVRGNSAVRADAIARIAGLPTGFTFNPDEAELVARRVRDTGAFRSVSLREAEVANPDGTLDFTMTVTEQQPRRFGFGAELGTTDGLTLSGFWLHRNIMGGAERLRLDAEVAGIGGETGGIDYSAGARFSRPATLRADTTLTLFTDVEVFEEPDFDSTSFSIGAELSRNITDDVPASVGVRFDLSEVTDASGTETYQQLFFPISATLDRRENPLNTNDGQYLEAEVAPFLGVGGSESGTRITADLRAYEDFGPNNRYVLAGRVQLGSIVGASITGLPNDERFYSGGGGTVRGQDYQSLDIDLGNGVESGGRSFLGASLELRALVRDPFSIVGFFDWGIVGRDSLPGGDGESHSGAGLGLRYDTGIGPIRLDVGVPVDGTPGGSDFHLYVGIGQAF